MIEEPPKPRCNIIHKYSFYTSVVGLFIGQHVNMISQPVLGWGTTVGVRYSRLSALGIESPLLSRLHGAAAVLGSQLLC